MALINKDSKLCDIIIAEPSVVTVLNRFNIFLGVGDKTVGDVCDEKHITKDFFITILNTYINEEYFPEDELKSFSVNDIIEYLNKTNAYYQHFQLPNIERHFNSLIARSTPENGNLGLLRNFFYEVKEELLSRIENDTNHWFKDVIKLESDMAKKDETLSDIKIVFSADESETIEEKLGDMINMLVIHLKGEYDVNLCFAVLSAIITLKKDILQNNRIRNRILRPLTDALMMIK